MAFTPSHRIGLSVTAGLVSVALLVGACSSAGGAVATVTITSSTSPTATDSTSSISSGEKTSTGQSTPAATNATEATTTVDAPGPEIVTVPATDATGVSPIAPVTVTVATGTITKASITTPEGRTLDGSVSDDGRVWTSTEPLGYGRAYTITAAAEDATGAGTATSKFTTLKPAGTIFPSFFPNPDMKTVGVGQPLVVIFDKPPADKAAAEKTLSVTTVPEQTGSWYWWDERTVHYRPQHYWQAGTKITVNANVYGVDLGGGMYGETDRTLKLTIGPKKVAKIDDATKQMKVYVDDKLTQTVAVSLGREKTVTANGKDISFVTPSGIYVAQERYEVKQMSSASYGLPVNFDLGYDSAIPLAVRLSNGGIFIHSAPWSVKDQGVRNVSHGCININPKAADWFYNNFSYGDIVDVTGTSTRLESHDGFGDWNIPWNQWQAGSALR